MKKQFKIVAIFASALIILNFSACTETFTRVEHEESIASLLNMEQIKRDSLERVYIATLDEIDGNLDAIREKHGLLILGPNSNGDFVEPKKDQIINNITMINGLLEDNKNKIAKLEKSLDKYREGKKELVRSIELAKEKTLIQEKRILDLKQLLTERDFKIEELSFTVLNQNNQINDLSNANKVQETKLNKTYFACGTYKQLKAKKIIKKEGGLLGIRKVKVLNENFDKEEFTEIDKSKTTSISMSGKDPKLITNHPEGTYEMERGSNDITMLTIKDPENFWRISKYLVVELH